MKFLTRMFYVAVIFAGMVSAEAGAANKPFPVVKNGSCPGGYYTSGGYCVPSKNTTKQAIPKVGSCPSGYVTSGNYCK